MEVSAPRRGSGIAFSYAVVASLWATVFVLTTLASRTAPPAVVISVTTAIAFVLSAVSGGAREAFGAARAARRAVATAVLGGVLAWWAAPVVALSQRSTDSPSGSETLWLTAAGWAVLCAFAAVVADRKAFPVLGSLAALAGAAGAATVLANWERPSSFSPFMRSPREQAIILAAGVAFALGSLLVARASRALGAPAARILGILGAAAVSLVGVAVLRGSDLPVRPEATQTTLYLGVATGLLVIAWTSLLRAEGLGRASGSLLLAPLVVTAGIVVERFTVTRGPDPVLWTGVAAGGAVLAAAALAIASVSRAEEPRDFRRPLALVGGALALASAVGAGGVLAVRGLVAHSEGVTPDGALHSVTWAMAGAETASGWLLASAAALAVALWITAWRGTAINTVSAVAVACVTCTIAALLVPSVPLHTWVTWIPAEVQRAYGTEYARFTTEGALGPIHWGVAVLAVTSAVLTTLAAAGSGEVPAAVTDTEESDETSG